MATGEAASPASPSATSDQLPVCANRYPAPVLAVLVALVYSMVDHEYTLLCPTSTANVVHPATDGPAAL